MANEIQLLNNELMLSTIGLSNQIIFAEDAGPFVQHPYVTNSNTLSYFPFNNNSLDTYGGFDAVTGSSMSYTSSGKFSDAIVGGYGSTTYSNITFQSNYNNIITGIVGSPITGSSGLTMGGWFYKTGTGNNQGIMYVGSTASNGGFGMYIPNGLTNGINLLYGGLIGPATTATIVDNEWTNIIFTLDDTATGGIWYGKCFVNGDKVYTATINPRFPNPSYGIQIGSMSNNGNIGNQQFNGNVDDFFIEKRTWTEAEVYTYFNG